MYGKFILSLTASAVSFYIAVTNFLEHDWIWLAVWMVLGVANSIYGVKDILEIWKSHSPNTKKP